MATRRLDRDVVERQIREMWAGLNSTPPGPIRDDAREQTRKIEAELRARLAAQDKADAAGHWATEKGERP